MKYLSAIRARVRQVLKDEFSTDADLEFKDDELDIYIRDCLQEISRKSPYKSREVLTTVANSKVLDISSIERLMEVEKLEYPTGSDPRDYRNFDWLDAETIEMRVDSAPSETGGSGTLTGTVTFTSGSATVTGSGTAFSSELEAGYHIKKSGGTRWYLIYAVDSDTQLTLAEPSRDDGADDVDVTQYCYETVYVYCAKPHELTEDNSTLRPQHESLLVQGASGRAAVAKSRKLIDSINVGGAGTPSAMQAWGLNQLALFKEGLAGLKERRVNREYPTG